MDYVSQNILLSHCQIIHSDTKCSPLNSIRKNLIGLALLASHSFVIDWFSPLSVLAMASPVLANIFASFTQADSAFSLFVEHLALIAPWQLTSKASLTMKCKTWLLLIVSISLASLYICFRQSASFCISAWGVLPPQVAGYYKGQKWKNQNFKIGERFIIIFESYNSK